MRVAQKINKFCFITTLILYLTIYFGLYAQIVLGIVQIMLALYVSLNNKLITKNHKNQIINYWIYVGLYAILISAFITKLIQFNDSTILLILIVILLPMSIATYFTITLNKIAKTYEKK